MSHDVLKLIAQLESDDLAQRRGAAEELSQLGQAAGPAAIPLALASVDSNEEVRNFAVAALEDMGPPSVTDADELAEMIGHESPDVGYWAVTLLGRLGKDAKPYLPRLVEALSPPADVIVRQRAAWALGKLGRAGAKAIDALKTAAASDNPRLVKIAKKSIEEIEAK